MAEDAKPRVLVVEDEPGTALSIKKLLEKRFGASVEVADCAAGARKKLADGFKLITLDYQMPDCDGLTLLKEIVALPDAPPVIMVTGHGDEHTVVDAFRFGASGYVVKDQRMPELLTDAVNKALLESRLREAERALTTTETEFQTLVETANSIILELDLDGNTTYMNRYGLEFFGYSEEELIGKNVRGHIIAEVDSEGRDLVNMAQTILADPDSYKSNENENIKKNGERVWVAWSNRALYDDEGNQVGTLAVGNDMTARKAAEAALLDQLNKLQQLSAMVDGVSDAIFTVDKDVRINSWNKGAEQMYGFAADEAIGRDPLEILHTEYTPGHDRQNDMREMEEKGRFHVEVTQYRKDGSRLIIDTTSWQIKDQDGNLQGITSINRDVTRENQFEERLTNILDGLPDAVFVTDRTGRLLYFNHAMQALFGREVPADRTIENIRDDLYRALKAGTDIPYPLEETPIIRALKGETSTINDGEMEIQGRRISLETTAAPILGPDGEVEYAVAVTKDITERKKAEEYLKHQARILENIDEAIIGLDKDLIVNSWSKGAEHMYGFTEQEAIGHYAPELLARDYPDGLSVSKMVQVVCEKGFLRQDKVHHRKDGRPVLVDGQSWPLKDSSGNIIGFVSLNRDITEQKKVNEDYRRLLETAGSIIIRTDNEGNIVFINDYGLRFFGYPEEELVGKNVVGTIVPEIESTGRDLTELIDKIMADPDSYHPNVNENLKRNGERVWVSWSNKAIRDANGDVIGTLTVGNDITDLKHGGELLASLNAELDGYAHMVSHDLKSPLAAIGMANAMLREDLADIKTEKVRSDLEETVDSIGRNLSRAFTLINDLLSLAEAGHVPPEVQLVNIAGTVNEILSERAGDLSEKGVEVSLDKDLGVVKAHSLHVYQVFSNIIGNAIRHNTSSEPAIGVHYLGRDGQGAHLYKVCDNGPGIPESDLETIFRPFFKRGKGSDTGIGLSIAKKIVEVYGGHIRAYNENGVCMEFSIKDWEPRDKPTT